MNTRSLNQMLVGLMDQRGGLEDVARALMKHVLMSPLAQFAIDERDQPFKRTLIALAPGQ